MGLKYPRQKVLRTLLTASVAKLTRVLRRNILLATETIKLSTVELRITQYACWLPVADSHVVPRISFSRPFSNILFNPFIDLEPSLCSYPTSVMADVDKSLYTVPNTVSVVVLECREAFEMLTPMEKKYAYYLARAAYEGSLIVLLQTSPESPSIFMLLQRMFNEQNVESLKANTVKSDSDITDEEFEGFLTYAAAFYSNMGNYKSFGDTKIIPGIAKEKFKTIVMASDAFKKHGKAIEHLWSECSEKMYTLQPRFRELGIGEMGISTYYSSNCVKEDATRIQEFFKSKGIVDPYNTRLFKTVDSSGIITYEVRLASVVNSDKEVTGLSEEKDEVAAILGEYNHDGCKVIITRGDYSPVLDRVVNNLREAQKHAANDNERNMLQWYIHSFYTGSINSHKNGSRHWIKDKGPVVESFIGFIESYRDPIGIRGEFEGFVAMVNKEMSAKFGNLVNGAVEYLKLLPWDSHHEKDKFLRPDFTSLEILAFAGSGIPAGINIPNYDEVRQQDGFKNVSLGNVLRCATADKNVTFLNDKDKELYIKYKSIAFEVQVGLHELLGHGSGKLFCEDKDGKLNFDVDKVKHLESGDKITSWYKHGETWDTVFKETSSAYEECRAECVGLHLCLSLDILKVFGHENEEAENVLYVNWLNMVRAGLVGLEFYSPETGSWKQAHMRARFVILRALLEAGDQLVTISRIDGEDGKPDLRITLDKSKIKTTGATAIAKLLRTLQMFKSTADCAKGTAFFNRYSEVSSEGPAGGFLSLRKIVIDRKEPRKMFVQAHTELVDDKVELTEFEGSSSGLIQSFAKRFPSHDADLEQLWVAEKKFHNYSM